MKGAAFLKKYSQEILLSGTLLRTETPNRPILQAYRWIFAFISQDSGLKFHLKNLQWVGPSYAMQSQEADLEPCVLNYVKDQNILLKKFADILKNPQQKISVRKMRELLYFFEDWSEEFDWLENHKIENYLVWTLCEFVKLTLVYLSHVFQEERGSSRHVEWKFVVQKAKSFKSSRKLIKKGLAKSQFGPKGCACHPEKVVGKMQGGKKTPDDPKEDLKTLERFAEIVGGDCENDTFC